jgi:diamine N-acetyltransferase
MTPVRWRHAGSDDADALAFLGAATFLVSFAFDHPGKALIDHLKTEHSREYYASQLARADVDIIIGETPLGAPVGYAMLMPPEYSALHQQGDLELKRIYLLGPWQSGGNGWALLQQIFDLAVARGARRLILTVYERNDRAVAFYERAGFAYMGDTIFMVGDTPFRDLLYVRDMSA